MLPLLDTRTGDALVAGILDVPVSPPTDRERRPILLLVNPAAGGKRASGKPLSDDPARLMPDALTRELRARGLDVRLRILAEGEDVGQLAREAADEHDVVVAGGDGTVGPAALALADSRATFGILALGSFNNIAHSVGVPMSLESAIDTIADGHVTGVDVGLAERDGGDTVSFLEAAGIGLDAVGFHAIQLAERRGVRRGLRYLWRALRRAPAHIELVIDGVRTLTDASTLVVCNGPYHGTGFAIVPDADPTDGELDVATFHGMGRLRTIVHFLRIARGREVREARVRVQRGARIWVGARRGTLPVHVDGRSIGVTPITFTVRPAALRLFR